MKKSLLLILISFSCFLNSSAQVICIFCFDQLDTISANTTNYILNGSFETTNCPYSTGFIGGPTWAVNASGYSCDLANWTCTGGGTNTYCSVYNSTMSVIPDGNNAIYFGNWYCNPCSPTQDDTTCLVDLGCTMTGVPNGYPVNIAANFGGNTGISMSQTVNGLTPGNVYALEFWCGGEDGGYIIDGLFGVDVGFGDTMMRNPATFPLPNPNQGRRYIVEFIANAPSHTIKFTNWGHICSTCSELVLDDVKLYPIAEANPNLPWCFTGFAANATATNPLCYGDCDGTATATPSGGIAPYTYLWSNTDTSQTITNLCAGTYMVTVVDAGNDTIMDTVTVLNPLPFLANILIDSMDCGGSATLVADLAGGVAPFSYVWNPGGITTDTAFGMVPGTYFLQVTDSNGCVATDSIVVPVIPPLDPGWTVTAAEPCLNTNSFELLASGTNPPGTTYFWTFQNGTPANSTSLQPTVTFNQAGWNNVSLIVEYLGCPDTLTQPLVVFANPVADAGLPVTFCEGSGGAGFSASVLSGIAPINFLWSCNLGAACYIDSLTDNDPHVNPPVSATYYLLVTDSTGCTTMDSVTATVNPLPDPSWVVTSSSPCFDVNEFSFLATGINPPSTNLSWTFENGIPPVSAVNNPVVSFSQSGQNLVTLVASALGCSDTLSNPIFVLPAPVADAGVDISYCAGTGGDTLHAVAMGGTSPYYYVWWCDSLTTWCGLDSVFDNDPIANPNGSTMYYVQVTDFNGCMSNIDSAFVTVNPLPIVDAGQDQYICSPPAPGALLNPSVSNSPGPFDYQWTPAIGLNSDTLMNPYARPDTTTIYTLQVTDIGTGCTSITTTVDTLATVTVIVLPLPVANAGPDIDLCLNDTVMLPGIGTAAGPLYDFEWSPATGLSDTSDANPLASPGVTTDYVLTVWSNGCPSIGDTVLLTVHTLPTVDAGPDVEACFSDSVMLDAQAGGDSTSTFYSFEWSPVAGLSNPFAEDPMVSPAQTGYYLVQSISSWGCRSPFDSALVSIKPTAVADAGEPLSVCAGHSVQLMGGYDFATQDTANSSQVWPTWSPNQFISDVDIFQPWVYPAQTQYYYLGVQYNTCFTVDSVLITVLPSPGSFISADTTSACIGDTFHLTGTGGLGGAGFYWIPSAGLSDPTVFNPTATPGDTTTYSLIVTEGQCSDTSSITLNPIPSPEVAFISSLPSGCVPFSVSFQELSNNSILFTWDFGDGSISNDPNPVHVYNQPGQYPVTLTGTNTGGCKATVGGVFVDVADTAHAEFSSIPNWPAELQIPNTEVQFVNESSNSISWTWNFSDNYQTNEFNPVHRFTEEGIYYVTLRAMNDRGCTGAITHGPYIVASPDLFIPNVFSPNADNVNDIYLVKYSGNQPFELNIFDRWGNLLFTQKDKYSGWDGNINNAPAPAGVYYYVVKVGDKDYNGNVTLVR